MIIMKIDGVGFNHEWARTKTETEFVDEFKGVAHIYPNAKDKIAKLKEAYALLKGTPVKDQPISVPYVAPINGAVAMAK
jgi:hypothetical protein